MTRGEDFIEKRKCKNKHCSAMSNIAWCDLCKIKIMRLHDYCLNPNCKYQKQNKFTPEQFQLEVGCFKNTKKRRFKGPQTAWVIFLKPGLIMATPLMSSTIAAKTKNSQSAQITTNILKSITCGKILSLTDLHGNVSRLKVM